MLFVLQSPAGQLRAAGERSPGACLKGRVDTLTHALSGALVGRLLAPSASPSVLSPPRVRTWQVVAAGFLAAAFPDMDFVLGYISELTYLRGHRGLTHSILLLPLWGLLLAWLFSRLLRPPGVAARPDWKAFYAVSCAALAIHIAGDLITQFGTMILAPLSDRRFGIGTTFIIDLVFTGLIVAGLIASACWRRSKLPAAVSLVLLAGWVGVGWIGRGEAVEAARAYAARQGIPVVAVDAAPRPASPFNWTAIVFDGERYHYAHINTRRSEPLPLTGDDNFIRRFSAPYLPVAMAQWENTPMFGGDPATAAVARAVWDSPQFAFYRWFAMFPVLDQASAGSQPGSGCAGFRDLRFDTPGRASFGFRYGLCREAADAPWRLYAEAENGRRWVDDANLAVGADPGAAQAGTAGHPARAAAR